jgi:hypothetical protein
LTKSPSDGRLDKAHGEVNVGAAIVLSRVLKLVAKPSERDPSSAEVPHNDPVRVPADGPVGVLNLCSVERPIGIRMHL